MGNGVTFFEIQGTDATRSSGFYRELFDWAIEPAEDMRKAGFDGYCSVPPAGDGIFGGLGNFPEARVVIYVQVEDVPGVLQKAVGLGATAVLEPLTLDNRLVFALFDDPAGNRLGIWKPPG